MKESLGRFMVGLVVALGLLCYGGLVQAATLNVCKSGCTYSSIQDAIDDANPGDLVLVDDGVYTENINFNGLAITVQSVNGADYTTIDGNASGSVVAFSSGESASSVLDGFTLTNGSGTLVEHEGNFYMAGGGIFCTFSSSPMITNCTISGNSVDVGGGIFCDYSSPRIESCIISNNEAEYVGGGVFANHSSPIITHCNINGNSTNVGGGGGIHIDDSDSAVISECIISNNNSDDGGGIAFSGSSHNITVTNCVITGNAAKHSEGGGIHSTSSSLSISNCTISDNSAINKGGGISLEQNSSIVIVNSILWGDLVNGVNEEINEEDSSLTITYSDVQGGDPDNPGLPWPGIGNIDANPLFVGGGDYHLTAGSPCIDRGTSVGAPTDDIDGDVRPWDLPAPNNPSAYDMGSDEYAYLTISTDKSLYFTGDTMNVGLQTREEIPPIVADVYIRIVFPGGGPIYYYLNPGWTETPTPVVSSWTVTDWGPTVFFSYTFNGTETPGNYEWQAAFTEPGTTNIIGEVSSARFTFSP